jgi:hypothetical protein
MTLLCALHPVCVYLYGLGDKHVVQGVPKYPWRVVGPSPESGPVWQASLCQSVVPRTLSDEPTCMLVC